MPNLRGRVLSSESEIATVERGLYVVGWLKRGPTGIVATNLHCAEETVGSFVPLLSFIPHVVDQHLIVTQNVNNYTRSIYSCVSMVGGRIVVFPCS